MDPSSRDRISVDLRGMKAALVARARARGVLPSDVVREALVAVLGTEATFGAVQPMQPPHQPAERVRVSLRMSASDATALLDAAQGTEMTAGDFVTALLARTALLQGAQAPAAQLATLTASCAELATLSRNLHHLTSLLRQGSVRAAQEYRAMLDHVGADVHAHLAEATSLIAQLRPLIRPPRRDGLPTST